MSTNTRQGLLIPFIASLFPVIASVRTITHPDFWLHIAMGRAGVLRNETFSLASDAKSYVDVYWLYNLLTAWLYGAGGYALVTLIHAAAVGAGFVFLVLAARRYASGLPIGFAVFLSTCLMLPKLDARPILLAMPFMAFMIYSLESKTAGIKKWVGLGVGQWFWMGFHPSFLGGPLLCMLYAFHSRREKKNLPKNLQQELIGVTAVLSITFLNPYGPGLHAWVLSHSPITFLPISLTNLSTASDLMGAGRFQMVLYAALAVVGIGLLLYKEKLPFALTAAALATAFISVITKGRITYHLFAVFGFLFFALSFESIGRFVSRQAAASLPLLGRAGRCGLGLLTLTSLALLASGSFFQVMGSASRLGLGLNHQVVTDEAIAFMQSEDFPEVMIHFPMDGGKLIASLPNQKIFVDQRSGAYPSTLFTQLTKALIAADLKIWNELDERFRPGAVLFNLTIRGSQHGIRMLLEAKEWTLVYFDGISAVLVRSDPAWAPLTENRKSQLVGLKQIEKTKSKTLAAFQKKALPIFPFRLAGAGSLFLTLDRYPQSNLLLELVHAAAPRDTEILYQLGISRYNIQDLDRAEGAFFETVSRQPGHVISWLWLARIYEKQGKQVEASRAFSQAYALNPKLADQVRQTWSLKTGVYKSPPADSFFLFQPADV